MMAVATRVPLAPLPLTLPSHPSTASTSFIPPSPTSLPLKRPASAGRATEGSRKVSRTEKNGSIGASGSAIASGSGRRGSADITPKVKARLDRDELGTGKSPARRLFVNDEQPTRSSISGISGASALPTPSSSHSQPQSPFLAPSPPLACPALSHSASALSLPLTEADENGVVRSIHDPGFPVHPDDTATAGSTGVGIGTPKSKRTNSIPVTSLAPPSTSASLSSSSTRSEDLFFPPTPSSSASRLEDQENIPPPMSISRLSTPSSSRSQMSPKKSHNLISASGSSSSSRSTRSGTGSSAYEEEDTVLAESGVTGITSPMSPAGLSGMSGRSRNGRSKLAQVILRRGGSSDSIVSAADEEEGEELTPGRRAPDPRGKELLAKEADQV